MMFGKRAGARVVAAVVAGDTPFRALQNVFLGGRAWRPGMRVLDIGGSPARSGTKVRIPFVDARVVYADQDDSQPDIVAWDVTQPAPDNLGRFDCVLLLNVLEHVFDPAAVFRSVEAAIQPGGELVIITPYLFPYHRAPADYYRFSDDWYRAAAAAAGYELVELVPLTFGCASDIAGFGVAYAYMFRWSRPLRPLVAALYAVPVLFDLAAVGLLRRLGRGAASYFRNPLGYAVVMRPAATAARTAT